MNTGLARRRAAVGVVDVVANLGEAGAAGGAGYARAAMAEPVRIDTAVQRDMLQVALRNSARSVWLLLVAVGFIAWLGWQHGQAGAGAATLAIGVAVAAWRWQMSHRHANGVLLSEAEIDAVVRELEFNSFAVGLMWVVATVFIYPALQGTMATVYVVVVCGSVATAAFFMSMAGRSFGLLTLLQMGSLAAVCVLHPVAYAPVLSVLAVVYGLTMWLATQEFRATALQSLRHGIEADRANASLLRAKEAAEAANLAKSQFLATMSHETRTPLNGVLGALDLLRDTPLDLRQRRLVKTAADSGQLLMGILNDVLDHSRIEAGKLQLVALPMSLHSVAAASAAMFRADAERQDIQVVLDVGEGVPDGVMGDAPRLQQVLLNLLGNGLKFTERGSVTLRLRALTGRTASLSRVRFEVIDTGIGIPQVAQAQIFQPFHQVDGTRSRLHGGIGLGLSISQRIVEAMGGQVQVISRAGSGSTFFFELDLPLASTGVPRPLSDSEFGSLGGDMSLHGTVLLVEDNMVNRLIAVEMLRSFGLEVIEAEDGAQALTLLDQQSVDLVLMDIHMPVLDGYAATQKARKRETALRLPRVPIVALTANAFEEDTRRSLEVGMDAHLAKPYSRVQLHKVLQRWLA